MDREADQIRLAELLAALSLATDLGMGQPLGHAMRCCLIACGIADALGLSAGERAEAYYVGLLRYLGCTADAAEIARFAGDEIGLARAVAPFVMGDAGPEQHAVGRPGVERAKAQSLAAHCEAAALLATRLPLGAGVVTALRHGFERWDGRGHPDGLAGEQIPRSVRIAVLARDVEVYGRDDGFAAARQVVSSRRGRAYDPVVADAFDDVGERVLAESAAADWAQLLDVEPVPIRLPASRLAELLEVMADFADVKLPHALGHSRGVARLAQRAADELGIDGAQLYRAGLVHDLGRTGVSNAIWDKPGRLSVEEVERVRLHPYLSEQVLTRTPLLRPLAALAGAHHERLDGSGYYRGISGSEFGMTAQVLAGADVFAAMRQTRPHRPAASAPTAAAELAREASDGRFSRRVVAAVLAAAGAPDQAPPAHWPAGLTDREVQVLRLACRGTTRQHVAQQLCISPKTVSRHLENAYGKMGVSTRAGAALFAVQHGLLTTEP